jgi:hypothetical protein
MFPVWIASVGHAASGTQGLQALMWGENAAVKVFAGGMALSMREEVRHYDEKLERKTKRDSIDCSRNLGTEQSEWMQKNKCV